MASAHGENSKEICETYNSSMKEQYSVMPELCEDNILDVLKRLPRKSLCRFKCVSKNWFNNISGLLELKISPCMMGFFYQNIGNSKRAQIRFLHTLREDSPERRRLAADTSFDQSVGFLEEGQNVYVVASSNGFLLCCGRRIFQMIYYIYNPATKKYITLPKPHHRHERVAVGFSCMVDDPANDLINYTIVRYGLPVMFFDLQSAVIIESFSSETSEWTPINITLDVPHCLYPVDNPAVVIDGVFFWLDKGPQIFAVDIGERCCWLVDLPHEEISSYYFYYLSVSNGILHYMFDKRENFSIWALKSHHRCPNPEWLIKFHGNFYDTIEKFPQIFGPADRRGYMVPVAFHPAYPHIVYLDFNKKVISFDLDNHAVELVGEFNQSFPSLFTMFYRYFPYEWPRILPALKSI